MRTYPRQTFVEAQRAWQLGNFGSEWRTYRELAAQRGFLYPPAGSERDDRDAENPSQRAIVYRAIVDNPTELLGIVGRSRSWSDVVDRIIGLESRLREDADFVDRDAEYERAERPTYRESVSSLATILARIGDSW